MQQFLPSIYWVSKLLFKKLSLFEKFFKFERKKLAPEGRRQDVAERAGRGGRGRRRDADADAAGERRLGERVVERVEQVERTHRPLVTGTRRRAVAGRRCVVDKSIF